jgi:hypothetical protein
VFQEVIKMGLQYKDNSDDFVDQVMALLAEVRCTRFLSAHSWNESTVFSMPTFAVCAILRVWHDLGQLDLRLALGGAQGDLGGDKTEATPAE